MLIQRHKSIPKKPVIESIEEIEKAISTRISGYEKYGFGRWATFLRSRMQFVGWSGLPEFDEIDLEYRFLPEYWELGIATES